MELRARRPDRPADRDDFPPSVQVELGPTQTSRHLHGAQKEKFSLNYLAYVNPSSFDPTASGRSMPITSFRGPPSLFTLPTAVASLRASY